MTLSKLRAEWAPNVTRDLLAGTVVALALIPDAIAFSIIAGVDPKAFAMATGLRLHAVGDMGELPFFALPQVPLTFETLRIILPYALTLTMVGLLESLMTAAIIGEMTDSTSDKNREYAGRGLANITSGLFFAQKISRSFGVASTVHAAHFWDLTGINALDRVMLKFRHHGVPVDLVGMNEASQTLVDRLALHDKPGAALPAGGD